MTFFGVYLTDVLKEMCSRVGADFYSVDFSKDNWFLEYSWTTEDQSKFIKWFAMFLKNKGVRSELCKYPSLVKTYQQRETFAKQFVYQFGWKIK